MDIPVKTKLRKRVRYKSVLNDAFTKKFLRQHPQYSEEIKRTKDLRDVIKLFHGEVVEEMKKNPHGIVFPKNFAVMFINNCGVSKKKAIDYANSKKLGRVIYHNNFETEGNLMKVMFLNHVLPSGVSNNKFYYFLPTDKTKSLCSQYFRKNWANCISYKPIAR